MLSTMASDSVHQRDPNDGPGAGARSSGTTSAAIRALRVAQRYAIVAVVGLVLLIGVPWEVSPHAAAIVGFVGLVLTLLIGGSLYGLEKVALPQFAFITTVMNGLVDRSASARAQLQHPTSGEEVVDRDVLRRNWPEQAPFFIRSAAGVVGVTIGEDELAGQLPLSDDLAQRLRLAALRMPGQKGSSLREVGPVLLVLPS
jgi:hypothetical protein